MHEPIVWSWPSCRARPKNIDKNNLIQDENDDQVSTEQLQSWIRSLEFAGGELLVSADTLELLPGRIPYEVFGACLLAAVDSQAAAATQHANSSSIGSEAVEQIQQQQHVALKLHKIDLQEPISGPLTTCFTGYPDLQHLSLQELNVDANAAAALVNIIQQTSCTSSCQSNGTNSSSSSGGMKSLSLHSVFLCQLAWQQMVKGLSTRCQLHTLRLTDCLTIFSLNLLAQALPSGCSSLQHLDLSCNTLRQPREAQTPKPPAQGTICAAVDSSCDQAWAQFLTALEAPACCPQLQVLVLDRCSLGPSAAAALTQVLSAKSRSNLQQLSLVQCEHMGEVAVRRLSAAVRHHPSLAALDMSCTSLSDQCLIGMLGSSSSSMRGWWRQQRACQQLRRLCLAGNSQITAAAVECLVKSVMSGGMAALRVLDVAQCPHLGDEGAVAMASCILSPQCQLLELNMSGCEITDAGAAALAAAVGQHSSDSTQAIGGTPADGSSNRNNSSVSCCGGVSSSNLLELRLADNQITAIGLQALAEAISHQSCCLRLLDVSFNWAGPEAMRPLALAAEQRSRLSVHQNSDSSSSSSSSSTHAASDRRDQISVMSQPAQHSVQQSSSRPVDQPPHMFEPLPCITVLRECSHEWWRVEAAKAGARAAAAADAAAVAAAEAAAAAAAAAGGSSWDPYEHPQSPAQQHPAVGIRDNSCNAHGSCCSSSIMTHAGSLSTSRQAPCTDGQAAGNAVWLFNGLYAAADVVGSPDSLLDGAAACEGATAAHKWRRRSSSSSRHSIHLTSCGTALQTDLPVDHKVSAVTLMGSRSAENELQFSATRAAAVSTTATSATAAAPGAISCLHIPRDCDGDSDGDGSGGDGSSMSDCMQQEASFKFQVHDDVVHSPTRYDQQLQEQQQHHLKGVSWSEELSLSPHTHSDCGTCAPTSPNLLSGPARLDVLEPTQACASTPLHPAEDSRAAAQGASYRHHHFPSTDTSHPAHVIACAVAGTSDGSRISTTAEQAAAAALAELCQGHHENQEPLLAGESHHAAAGNTTQRPSDVSTLTFTDRQTAGTTLRARPPATPRRPRCGLQVRMSSQPPRLLTRAVNANRPVAQASHTSDIESQAVRSLDSRSFTNNRLAAGHDASLKGTVFAEMLAQKTAAAPATAASGVTTEASSSSWSDSQGAVQPDMRRRAAAAAAAAGGADSALTLLSSLTLPVAVQPTAGAAAVARHPQPATLHDCSPDSVKSSVRSGVNSPVSSSARSARSEGRCRSARPRISIAESHVHHVAHLQQQQQYTAVSAQAGHCSTAAAMSRTADLHNSASRRITSTSSTGVLAGRVDITIQQQQQQQQQPERLLAKAMQTCNSATHGLKAVASSGSLWQDLVLKQQDDDDAGHAQSDIRHAAMVVPHAGNYSHALPAVGG